MPKEYDPERIREKISAGLTREQAIEALDRQAEQDLARQSAPMTAGQTPAPEKKPRRSASAEK
jgi:hypothetical protein